MTVSTPAIKVDHLSKKFARSLKHAMWYGLQDIARAALIPHRFRSPDFESRVSADVRDGTGPSIPHSEIRNPKSEILRPQEFWALHDVSFEVAPGECIGLIGANGAGKSTLFSVLSGIYGPTAGRVEIRGKLQALVALGAGFHPMLTGRENIYINGAVLGLKDRQIDRLFNDIVDFSELRDFIDMPVKNYSSGMYVRLGFSVAVHLNPDVLLVDEVLAVGDLSFQRKCIERIHELRESHIAIAFVSHSLYQIESLCDRVIWLDRGRVRMEGPVREVVAAYRDHDIRQSAEGSPAAVASNPLAVVESACLRIDSVTVCRLDGTPGSELTYGEPFKIRVAFTAKEHIKKPLFNLRVMTEGFPVFEAAMLVDGQSPDYIDGPGVVECVVRHPRLLPRPYEIILFVRSREGVLDLVDLSAVGHFTISSDGLLKRVPSAGPYALGHLMTAAPVYFEYEWDVHNAVERQSV